jgi:hypothetical protein
MDAFIAESVHYVGMQIEAEGQRGPKITMMELNESIVIFTRFFATNLLVQSELVFEQWIPELIPEAHFYH